jgi:hypothetical protein
MWQAIVAPGAMHLRGGGMERTLAILKPDAVSKGKVRGAPRGQCSACARAEGRWAPDSEASARVQAEAMKELIEADGFKIIKEKKLCLTVDQVLSPPPRARSLLTPSPYRGDRASQHTACLTAVFRGGCTGQDVLQGARATPLLRVAGELHDVGRLRGAAAPEGQRHQGLALANGAHQLHQGAPPRPALPAVRRGCASPR